MSNCTFLIGNGINRAVCNESFKLESGMKKAWLNVSEDIRTIISDTLKNKIPTTEEELAEIQAQIFTILSIQNDLESLHKLIKEKLNLHLVEIKENYFSYLFAIAKYFYNLSFCELNKEKFITFSGNFSEFIKRNGSTHVATLNYDCMLYGEFLENGILKEDYEKTYLVDGFLKNGFQEDNLEPKYGHNFGWYLHLHGSPLYYTDGNIIRKSTRNDALTENIEKRNHIVLCSQKQKSDLIKHSNLLEKYFNFFKIAISQSKHIIVIGYGGKDEHINNVIKEYGKTANIVVIERNQGETEEYWKNKLISDQNSIESPPKLKIEHLDSILDFDFFSLENFS